MSRVAGVGLLLVLCLAAIGCGLLLDSDPTPSASGDGGGVMPTCSGDCGACGVCTDGVCRPLGADEVCRPASSNCDVAERCDGTSLACPRDVVVPAGDACGAGLVCDGDGACVACVDDMACQPIDAECASGRLRCGGDGSATCEVAEPLPAGTTCRAALGDCDVEETCDGASRDCPADAVRDATFVCRDASDLCDEKERCDGVTTDCPPDQLAMPGTECRAAAGPCDVPESCDGMNVACPPDTLAPSDTVCRPAVGGCDYPETCVSGDVACPTDRVFSAGMLCAGSPTFTCDGVRADCSGGRAPLPTSMCVVTSGTCMRDSDCHADGCGGEVCTSAPSISTPCICSAPAASCGCVAGVCTWYRVP